MNIHTPPHQLLSKRCKTLKAITGYEYTQRTPTILEFLIWFRLLFDSAIPDVSTYEKTRRQGSTTTKSRKSTSDQNGPKRKLNNKCRTQFTQDEVSDTDTEQQTSEQ